MAKETSKTTTDTNRDPISGEPGAHPVGTGVGAALGGAAAGAVLGTAAGPVGTVAGAVVGAIGGGLAGKAVAEQIDPTAEAAYWRDNYSKRPYYSKDVPYDTYAPAYQHGWESRTRHADRRFDDVEADLRSEWEKSNSELDWDRARLAARDAWDRADSRLACHNPK